MFRTWLRHPYHPPYPRSALSLFLTSVDPSLNYTTPSFSLLRFYHDSKGWVDPSTTGTSPQRLTDTVVPTNPFPVERLSFEGVGVRPSHSEGLSRCRVESDEPISPRKRLPVLQEVKVGEGSRGPSYTITSVSSEPSLVPTQSPLSRGDASYSVSYLTSSLRTRSPRWELRLRTVHYSVQTLRDTKVP